MNERTKPACNSAVHTCKLLILENADHELQVQCGPLWENPENLSDNVTNSYYVAGSHRNNNKHVATEIEELADGTCVRIDVRRNILNTFNPTDWAVQKT